MKNRLGLILILNLFFSMPLMASFSETRTCTTLSDGWLIHRSSEVKKSTWKKTVRVPHTWNTEYEKGTLNYERNTWVYHRPLELANDVQGKRIFLYFEGVNSVANVFVNRRFVGEHRGGYTAFCYEITDFVKPGAENELEVWVSNSHRLDVLPLSGDFNVCGGIHRPVHLFVTGSNCISPLDYASTGVYLKPLQVNREAASFELVSKLSLQGDKKGLQVQSTLFDRNGKKVWSQTGSADSEEMHQKGEIRQPLLWNGRQAPNLYTLETCLFSEGKLLDRVVQKTGFRSFYVDANRGFFLNGDYLNLYGFCRHEETMGKGSAVSPQDIRTDLALIDESGATSMRLTHYPHSDLTYDLCDSIGIVLWTEIPHCGPGGFAGMGYTANPRLEENLRTNMLELIRQKYNHPSICFWGLFNEVLTNYDSPVPTLKSLDSLAKKEDPSRLTAYATCYEQECFLETADLVGWNKYYGWYQANAIDAGGFFDEMKAQAKGKPVGVSEYGAGASIQHHQNPVQKTKPNSNFHPEEWQSLCHEGNWEAFSSRPYLWGKFIWVFADFPSSIRSEGDTPGMNDKGLVTHDRSVRKDAFYFYKANWNKTPMVYITSRRHTDRTNPLTDIKVYSNLPELRLFVNEKDCGKMKGDSLCRVVWKQVALQKGENKIRVVGSYKGIKLEDQCSWNLQNDDK